MPFDVVDAAVSAVQVEVEVEVAGSLFGAMSLNALRVCRARSRLRSDGSESIKREGATPETLKESWHSHEEPQAVSFQNCQELQNLIF